MRKKAAALLVSMIMVLAMSMTAMAAPSPFFPDPDYLETEPPTESETETHITVDEEKEPTPETDAQKKSPVTEKKDFPDPQYLLELDNGKSDTSPKTGEGMGVLYVAMAALAFAGTAYLAKKRLAAEE